MWIVLSLLTAAMLACTSVLKMYALFTDPYAVIPIPGVMVSAIAVELMLAAWLLSNSERNTLRWFCVGFFVVMAAISGWMWWTGQSNCGCLGLAASIHPSIVMEFDLVMALTFCMVKPTGHSRAANSIRSVSIGITCTVMTLAIFVTIVDHPKTALDRLVGREVSVEPALLLAGSHPLDTQQNFTVTLRNLTGEEVSIVGGRSACTCLTTGSLPVTIQPHSAVKVSVSIVHRGSPGTFNRQMQFLTDSGQVIVARFYGKVLN